MTKGRAARVAGRLDGLFAPREPQGAEEQPADERPKVRWADWDGRSLRVLGTILCAALLLVGWWWWQGRPREAVPVLEPVAMSSTASAPAQVVVHVIGAVRRPGLVTLPQGSRISDAVAAAGGAKNEKALDSVNLARVVVDGEQIVLGASAQPQASGGPISLNAATADQLDELPGVGPVLAERIVQWRADHGPFRSIDELGEVSGIGDSILAQLRPRVTL